VNDKRGKVKQKTYNRIDNDLYNEDGYSWWQSDSPLYLLQCSFNPARMGYFKKVLCTKLNISPQGKAVLEVGCGGGLLCEEIARMGFDVNGIDPSENSIRTAIIHAKAGGLRINYEIGTGEALPYRDKSMDIIFCCDVLEHVRDLSKVISEISRILKPGGIFCYDTLNRTLISKLVAIKISQEWSRWAFAPPNLHVWKMFIKPEELKSLLGKNSLKVKENKGMVLNVSFPVFLHCLRKRAKGLITYKDIGKKLFMIESENKSIMYMGYAIKNNH
jgi:2-polyprenyl-6-hydroxyphenyl methylase/3-demethylubiquinone-9 3-methyltransferase